MNMHTITITCVAITSSYLFVETLGTVILSQVSQCEACLSSTLVSSFLNDFLADQSALNLNIKA